MLTEAEQGALFTGDIVAIKKQIQSKFEETYTLNDKDTFTYKDLAIDACMHLPMFQKILNNPSLNCKDITQEMQKVLMFSLASQTSGFFKVNLDKYNISRELLIWSFSLLSVNLVMKYTGQRRSV